jgi:uncharacterized protein YndB with AHSA1/START domain/DNA-binding transcriptional ArsR family regulator
MVTYVVGVEKIFKALADATRRKLLDALRRRDGQTLTELEQRFAMTRFGVMKHLRILEAAGLVVTRKVGREKLHYLNTVPIRSIHDRWISKYAEPWAAALAGIKNKLEGTMEPKPRHIFQTWIRTTPEKLWHAITDPEETKKYFYGTAVDTDWKPGSPIAYVTGDVHELDGRVVEVVPNERLVVTFEMTHNPAAKEDPPSRVTWQIEPQKDGLCKLTVTHDDFAGETATYQAVGGGWPFIISGLKTLLETGKPLAA